MISDHFRLQHRWGHICVLGGSVLALFWHVFLFLGCSLVYAFLPVLHLHLSFLISDVSQAERRIYELFLLGQSC